MNTPCILTVLGSPISTHKIRRPRTMSKRHENTRRPSRHTAATMERKFQQTAPTRHPASSQTDLTAWAVAARQARA